MNIFTEEFFSAITAIATFSTATFCICEMARRAVPIVKNNKSITHDGRRAILLTRLVTKVGTIPHIHRDEEGKGTYIDSGKKELPINITLYNGSSYEEIPPYVFVNGEKIPTQPIPKIDFFRNFSFDSIRIELHPMC